MRSPLTKLLAVAFLLTTASGLWAAPLKGQGESVEEWVRILTDLRESNIALPITTDSLAVTFHLRDLPVLLRLTTQPNDYAINLFMNVDGRGMLIQPGFNCYVDDFMTFEAPRNLHVFVKIRVPEINMPVWTTLENLENAVWGNPAP
jgi:hypothetical protein